MRLPCACVITEYKYGVVNSFLGFSFSRTNSLKANGIKIAHGYIVFIQKEYNYYTVFSSHAAAWVARRVTALYNYSPKIFYLNTSFHNFTVSIRIPF